MAADETDLAALETTARDLKRAIAGLAPGWFVTWDEDDARHWTAYPQPVLRAETLEGLLELIAGAHENAGERHPALRFAPGTPIPWQD